MSRNTDSHFGEAPMKNIRRSSFKRPFSLKTTFNTGEIIPIYADEVLPGDTVKLHTASLVRGLTPITPVMDNAWLDTYYFFIPRRLTWDHWKEFMGENTTDAWTQTTQYQIPQLTIPSGGWNKGTLGEKLYGLQSRGYGGSVDAQYARSYVMCFNEWFRNENITEPAAMSTGDSTTTGTNGNDYVIDMECGGQLGIAVKYADYFTRCLPEPQKGPDIYLPLGSSAPLSANSAKTYGNGKTLGLTNGTINFGMVNDSSAGAIYRTGSYNTNVGAGTSGTSGATSIGIGVTTDKDKSGIITDLSGITADLSNATSATINELRQAFAIQRMYEIDARGGKKTYCLHVKKIGEKNWKAKLKRAC